MKSKIHTFLYFTVFFALLVAFNACNKKKDSIPSPLQIHGTGNKCLGCQDYVFIKHFDKVSGTIRQIQQSDYAYQKQQYYVEVDPKDITELGENAPIRIFMCDSNIKLSDNLSKKVMVTGDIYDCVTEYHGQPTLNLYTFHVLE